MSTTPVPAAAGRDGAPTPAELAAIVAAVEMAWPRAVVVSAMTETPSPWRWSGRWWTARRPVAADRRRP